MSDFINPEKILEQLHLQSDMVAAEFGCGSGSFTFPLARELEDGLVYAIDIQTEPLSALKGRSLVEGIKNIKIIRSDLEKPRGSTIPEASVDAIFIPNVLFEVDNKTAIISEAERILKKGGFLIIIDWSVEASQGPEKDRVSLDEIKKMVEKLGLKSEKELDAGKYHFAIVFSKP